MYVMNTTIRRTRIAHRTRLMMYLSISVPHVRAEEGAAERLPPRP
jgi:hypothetical protein